MAQADFIVKNGAVILNGLTATSTSTTSGALVIQGGIATSGQSTFGGNLNIVNTTTAVSDTTGALTVVGGVGITGDLWVKGVNLTQSDPHVVYVSESGNDANDGLLPQSSVQTIKQGLILARNIYDTTGQGADVSLHAGVYVEEFPLYVSTGTAVKGAGLRQVTVRPTTATNTFTGFLLDGETTISDFAITSFYKPGYAFAYAPNAKITTRSPYVERFSVITRGSNPTANDPYGYDSNDAGGGAYLDGSQVDKSSLEAAFLFNEATFITPSSTAIYATNGTRVELLNGFSYFSEKGIHFESGSEGWGGAGQTKLRLANTTGTFAVGDFLYYKGSTGTVVASGEIAAVDSDYIYIDGKASGFIESADRAGKVVNVYGNTEISSFQRKIGNGSVHFTTDGDLLDIVSDADLQYGTGAYTLEAWVFLDQGGRTQQIFNKGTTVATEFGLYIDSANKVTGQHSSTLMTGTSVLSTGTWYHVALSRDTGNNLYLFVDGGLEATDTSTANTTNGESLTIGGKTGVASNSIRGYIDEARVSSVARYTAGFTPLTISFNSDISTTVLIHGDGADTSIDIKDDGQGSQNVYTTTATSEDSVIASAQAIILADYRQFGGELRSIGSAVCYGNYGIYADGEGVDLKAIAFNMSYIGSGKDLSNDATLAVQANEIISLNGAKVYYQTVDHIGDFRVGPEFRINQRTGNVDFGTANFRLGPLSSLTVSDGVNAVVVQPSSISVGSLLLGGNRIQTISGNLILDPNGSLTTIESDLQVNGGLNFTGQFLATSVANSTSTTTGAIVVSGGIGLAKDLYVGGNATVAGNLIVKGLTTTVNSTQTSISDPVLDLGTGADNTDIEINDGWDRGLLFHYNTSPTQSVASYTRSFFGMDNASEDLVYKVGVANGTLTSLDPDFSSLGSYGGAKFGRLYLELLTPGSPSDGALVVKGGGSIAGELYVQNTQVVTTGTINQYAVTEAIGGEDIDVDVNIGIVTFTNTSTLQSVTSRGSQTDQIVYFTNTTNSFNTITGAVVITGGLGVGQDIHAEDIYSNGALVVTEGTIGALGITALYAGTDTAVSSQTGIVYVWSTSTLETVTSRGSSTSHIITFTNTEESTATDNGSVVVSGGVGVGGNLNASQIFANVGYFIGGNSSVSETTGDLIVTGGAGIGENLNIAGITTVLSNQSSIDTSTGALLVVGGVGIGQDLNVEGEITSNIGQLTLNGISSLINATSNLDITGGSNLGITSVGQLTIGSSLAVVFTDTSVVYINGTVNATNSGSGALVVAGGAGFGGNIYAANIFSNNSQVITSANLGAFGVTSLTTGSGISISTTTGAVIIESIDTLQDVTNRWSTTTNIVTIQNDTAASNTATAALIVQGGGIASDSLYTNFAIVGTNLQVDGSAQINDVSDASNETTGVLTVAGGVGVAKSLWAAALYDDGQRVVTKINPNSGPGITITDEIGIGTATSFTINNAGVIAAVGSAYIGISSATGIVTITNLGVQTLTAGTDTSVSRSTGTVTIWSTSTLQSVTNRGATTDNAISITNTTDANTSTAGALIVGGGAGVAKNLIVGGNAAVYGNLQVYGKQTYVNSTQTVITDPVIGVGAGIDNSNLGVNDGLDRGILMHYNTTATENIFYDNHAFLGMDNATQTLVYKTDVYPEGVQEFPALFSNTGSFGLAQFGGLSLTNNTVASNTSTGALTVDGGVGIGGALYVKDAIFVNGNQVLTSGGGGGSGYVEALYAGTDTAVSANAGEVTIWNTSTLHSVTERGNQTAFNIIIGNVTTASNATENGAFKVSGDTILSKSAFIVNNAILGAELPAASDSNANLFLPFRGTPGTYRNYVELQAVNANDVSNLDGGAFIKFRTSTTAAYGPEIGGVRRASGDGDFVIRTGSNTPQDRVTVKDDGDVVMTGDLSAGSLQNTPVGSVTSSTARFTTLEANGAVKLTNTTEATSSVDGAVVVGGGLAVGSNIVVGPGAETRGVKNANIYASGSFTTAGDAQAGTYVLRKSLGTTSLIALTTDEGIVGTTNQITLLDNSSYTFKVLVTARATASSNGGAWEFNGVITRDTGAGSTNMRIVNKTKIWSSLTGYDVEVVADTANGSLQVSAKGHDSNFVRFVARVDTVEVTT